MIIDSGLSTTSVNPAQNRVITLAISSMASKDDMAALTATVNEIKASVDAEIANRTSALDTAVASLKTYIVSKINEVDWLDGQAIYSYADDEISSRMSEHGADLTAHPDIRSAIANGLKAPDFLIHTENDRIHVSTSDRMQWNAAALAIDDHLSDPYYSVAHITAEERNKWSTATQTLTAHVTNPVIHVTEGEKASWREASQGLSIHLDTVEESNSRPHVTLTDRILWDGGLRDLEYHMLDEVSHVQPGERGQWTGAVNTLDGHVRNTDRHVTETEKAEWASLGTAVMNHLSGKDPSGNLVVNPHNVTPAAIGTYTSAEIDEKIAAARDSVVNAASTALSALLAGGVKFRGIVNTFEDLSSISDATDGDAYIVDQFSQYVDTDGSTVNQSCVFVYKVSGGSGVWHSFSEPFTVDLSDFATSAYVNQAIEDAISAHDDADYRNAHPKLTADLENDYVDLGMDLNARLDNLYDKVDVSTFQEHVEDCQNPHHTTPYQIGTLPSSDITALIDEAKANVMEAIESKLGNLSTSVLKWKDVISDDSESTAKQKLVNMVQSAESSPWVKGNEHSQDDSPAMGDCYAVEQTAQMFVYVGISPDFDRTKAISDVDHPAFPGMEAWGWDDVGNIYNTKAILDTVLAGIDSAIKEHNDDESAHEFIQSLVAPFTREISITYGGEDLKFNGVVEAIRWCAEQCDGLATASQAQALAALVNGLFDMYSTRQPKLVAGYGVSLRDEPNTENTKQTVTKVSWDPVQFLKKTTVTGYYKKGYGASSENVKEGDAVKQWDAVKQQLINAVKNRPSSYIRGREPSQADDPPCFALAADRDGNAYLYIGRDASTGSDTTSTDLALWGWVKVLAIEDEGVKLPIADRDLSYTDRRGLPIKVQIVDRAYGLDFIDNELVSTYKSNGTYVYVDGMYASKEYVDDRLGDLASRDEVVAALSVKQDKLAPGPGLEFVDIVEDNNVTKTLVRMKPTANQDDTVVLSKLVLRHPSSNVAYEVSYDASSGGLKCTKAT